MREPITSSQCTKLCGTVLYVEFDFQSLCCISKNALEMRYVHQISSCSKSNKGELLLEELLEYGCLNVDQVVKQAEAVTAKLRGSEVSMLGNLLIALYMYTISDSVFII